MTVHNIHLPVRVGGPRVLHAFKPIDNRLASMNQLICKQLSRGFVEPAIKFDGGDFQVLGA